MAGLRQGVDPGDHPHLEHFAGRGGDGARLRPVLGQVVTLRPQHPADRILSGDPRHRSRHGVRLGPRRHRHRPGPRVVAGVAAGVRRSVLRHPVRSGCTVGAADHLSASRPDGLRESRIRRPFRPLFRAGTGPREGGGRRG